MLAALPIVVVLYFDNNTGRPDLDVLRKGFADMMVTDLTSTGGAQVVEREKLEKLAQELELQRTSFFDPATAQKLGRGVGAKYAITGAFLSVAPKLRVDVRVVEISTAKVVFADKVVGDAGKLFALQSKLVDKLTSGLRLDGASPIDERNRVPNVGVLIDYSKAVEKLDQGDLAGATADMANVAEQSPDFALAKKWKRKLERRLKLVNKKRAMTLERQREILLEHADKFLAEHDVTKIEPAVAKRYLGYRVIRGRYLGLQLKSALTPKTIHNVPHGKEQAVLPLMKAYVDNLEALERELSIWQGRITGDFKVAEDDEALAARLGLGRRPAELVGANAVVAKRWIAQFVTLGFVELAGRHGFLMRPTLGELEPARLKPAFEQLRECAETLKKTKIDKRDEQVVRTYDTLGLSLYIHDHREEAVEVWQNTMEAYPTSKQYGTVERHVQEALELNFKGRTDAERERKLSAAIAKCDADAVQKQLYDEADRALRETGTWGVKKLIRRITTACGNEKRFDRAWGLVYFVAADLGGRHQDCGYFEAMVAEYKKYRPQRVAKLRSEHPACR